MLKIEIGTKDGKIYDMLKKKKATLIEVGAVLLRLKQVEHELIKLGFENDIEIIEDE